MLLMILGGGRMQRPAYSEARKLGIKVIGVDPNPDAPCRGLADYFYSHDLQDIPSLVKIFGKHHVDGVMTLAADYPVKAVGTLNSMYNLSGISRTASEVVTDKAVLRNLCHDRGINSPHYLIPEKINEEAVDNIVDMLPVVVKPTSSSGGRGVTCIKKEGGEKKQIRDAVRYALQFSKNGKVIIESFIGGKEYSAETITFRGVTRVIAITEKITSGYPYFMEVGHNVPYVFDENNWQKVKRFLFSVIEGVGIDNSPAHIEFKVDEGVPVLVEVGARLGGGSITTELIPLATGINMVAAAINLSLGVEPEIRRTHDRTAGIRYLIPPPGVMKSVKGLDCIKQISGIVNSESDYMPGSNIPVIRDADGRKAYIIGVSESIMSLKAILNKACDAVKYEMN
ncbi:ATP-grasp domain-containing protein [Halomonas denitrificans]|uniref:ATP-grasp domain-containing protein n=1 Tax=Halomonas denitrificans TaxID=370769 RepID=UPI000D3439BA|nr:ATP-grasp domain-containing protein [Halomonas denitrificans]